MNQERIRKSMENLKERSLSLEEVVEFLNSLVSIDAEAMQNLIESRVYCSEELAVHPTVQVGKLQEKHEVGFLGVLNGMFGTLTDYHGPIRAIFFAGQLTHFELNTGGKNE